VRVTATPLTSGTITARVIAASYHWRNHPDWYPGNPKYRDDRPAPGPGGEANAGRKRGRLARFEVHLAELSGLSGGDLRYAEVEHVRRAGVLVGVGEKTARTYWRDLLRREESTP